MQGQGNLAATYEGIGNPGDSLHPYEPLTTLTGSGYGYDALNRRTYSGRRFGLTAANCSNGQVTLTTALDLPLLPGMQVTVVVQGVSDSAYNGSFTATVSGARTLTYAKSATPNAIVANAVVDIETSISGYDALGNTLGSTNGAGEVINYTYDVLNRQVSQRLPGQNQTTYEYDVLGNLVRSTAPMGQDGQGDPQGRYSTNYHYDALGRTLKVIQPLVSGGSPTTSYWFNCDGTLGGMQDPDGNVVVYSYDSLGRQVSARTNTSATDTTGHTETTGFDALGRIVRVQDRNGRIRTVAYDHLGRVTQEQYGAADGTQRTIARIYDDHGRLQTVSDGSAQTTNSYDELDRLTSLAQSDGTFSSLVGYTFESSGRRQQMNVSVNGVEDHEDVYTYNAYGDLSAVTQQSGAASDKHVEYVYDAAGRVLQILRYAGRTAAARLVAKMGLAQGSCELS